MLNKYFVFLMLTSALFLGCGKVDESWLCEKSIAGFYLGGTWTNQSNYISSLTLSNQAGIDTWAGRTHITKIIELQKSSDNDLYSIKVSFPEPSADGFTRRATLYYYSSEALTNLFCVKITTEAVKDTTLAALTNFLSNDMRLPESLTEGKYTELYYARKRQLSKVDITLSYFEKRGEILLPKITYYYEDFYNYLLELDRHES